MIDRLITELIRHPNKNTIINDHHLAGFLYFYHKDNFPNNSFSQSFRQQWAYNQLLKQKITQFQSHGLKFILLKGVALLDEIYPEIGSRFMSDIDLLVNKKDFEQFHHALKREGFELLKTSRWSGNLFKEEWSLIENGVQINIELHTQLFYHHFESWNFYLSQCSKEVDRFDPEFNFVYLSGHLAFQHTFIKLYWFIDLYKLYEKYKTYWDIEKIFFLAQQFKLKNSVLFVLSLCSHFEKYTFHPYFLDQTFLLEPHHSYFKYFFLKHLTKDSLFQAIHYDFLWFISRLEKK